MKRIALKNEGLNINTSKDKLYPFTDSSPVFKITQLKCGLLINISIITGLTKDVMVPSEILTVEGFILIRIDRFNWSIFPTLIQHV